MMPREENMEVNSSWLQERSKKHSSALVCCLSSVRKMLGSVNIDHY